MLQQCAEGVKVILINPHPHDAAFRIGAHPTHETTSDSVFTALRGVKHQALIFLASALSLEANVTLLVGCTGFGKDAVELSVLVVDCDVDLVLIQ